jgi:hypothetical protein
MYQARVSDLRDGTTITAWCIHCRHEAVVAVELVKKRSSEDEFVKHLGRSFRCGHCGGRGTEINARRALGHED